MDRSFTGGSITIDGRPLPVGKDDGGYYYYNYRLEKTYIPDDELKGSKITGYCPQCYQWFQTNFASYSEDKPFDGRCPSCRKYGIRMV